MLCMTTTANADSDRTSSTTVGRDSAGRGAEKVELGSTVAAVVVFVISSSRSSQLMT
jgi:hypothetical protein